MERHPGYGVDPREQTSAVLVGLGRLPGPDCGLGSYCRTVRSRKRCCRLPQGARSQSASFGPWGVTLQGGAWPYIPWDG